jgi:hypothetical protein
LSNYYEAKQKAYVELDNILQSAIRGKKNVSITMVLLEITRRHPVSEKAVKNRINDIAEVNHLVIVDNELICEVKR